MIYQYSYITESTFLPAVEWHFFKLRALPCENEFQRVRRSLLSIHPDCALRHNLDGQGNAVQWGCICEEHDAFRVVSEGEVVQERLYALHESPAPYYLAATQLTQWNEKMQQEARQIIASVQSAHSRDAQPVLTPCGDRRGPLSLAESLMHYVYNYLTYTPLHTTTATTALDVYQDPRGVCQDYAHLLIALCRSVGVHARYANGFIAGEGQTHAWVEVSDGQVWLPFDPTHDIIPQWGYVKIAHGRDASDCPTNRGRFYSWTSEQQSARVILRLTEGSHA